MSESLRILILEDNPTDADLVQFELQEAGLVFTAKVVMTENDFVHELQNYSPDLILSDYDFPQYNGALALVESRKNCPDTPFILVTGAVGEDRAIEILTQGAKDYVLKSRLQQRLAPAVRRALAEAREQKARKRAEEELREAHRTLENQIEERTAELKEQIEHRSRIEAALLKYNERLEILSHTVSKLLASDKPQQVVEELCSKVMKFLDCDVFFNFIVDDSAGRLHLNAYAGVPSETAREIEWLDFGVAVCGCAAQAGCRIVAENIPATPDMRTELVKSFGIKAYACHPLLQQDKVIGTLSFGTRTRIHFSDDDLTMMKAVADQVAIAMVRVNVEKALRQSERHERERAEELAAMLEATPVPVIIVHDSDATHMTGNRAADELLKQPRGAEVSLSAPPEVKPTHFKAIKNGNELRLDELPAQRAARGEHVKDFEFSLVFSDGETRHLLGYGTPLSDKHQQARGAVHVLLDVTERKKAETALRESEERYRELVRSSPEAIIVHHNGQFLYANPAALRLYGAESFDQLRSKTVMDLIPEDERAIIAVRMKQGADGERLALQETKLVRLDGRVIPVESVGGAVTYNGKSAVQIMIRDINERIIRENERKKYNRTLRALTKSSQAMMRATDERIYMEEVCRIIVEDCGYKMVWVGFAEDDEDKTVHPVAYSGFEEGYINTLKITWADTERGRGPTGTAIRTGKLTACKNMLTDPRFEPWRKEAIKRGYASSIVLPLMVGDKAFGALTIYSKEPDSFAENEEKLLAELANDLSYGITAIRLREALRESEERLHAIASNTPDHILMQDRDLRYQLVINPQLGLTQTDMLGKTDYDILELRDADKLTTIKRKVLETGNSVPLESSLRNPHGELEYFEGAYVPKLGPAGQVEGIIGYFRNVTEHKRTEAAILRAKEEWERTFDTIPDLITILDDRHRIVRANKAMANRLGVDVECCAGLACHEVVHGLSESPAFCPHSLTCRDGQQHIVEVHEPQLGGYFLVSTTPIFDLAGKLVGSVHVAHDITERKAAEDQLAKQAAQLQERKVQLEEINSELESFSYSISHDLRAPLRAIDGFSRIILRQQEDKFDEKTRHQFNLIRDNVKLMGVLIENILSFSRVQKTSMSISVIDMDKLAREVWKEIKAANKEQNIEFKIKKIKPGYGDHTLMRQVLFNLLSNAVKFTKNKKQGMIEMSCYIESGKTVYCIKDNGAGFDMAHYDKLFGVFQRLHSSEEYEGTGIGLAIVQRIINRHGGRIWANGEEGKGATFCYSLNSVPIDAAPKRRLKRRNS